MAGLGGGEGRRQEDKHMTEAWRTGGLRGQGGERLMINGGSFI